MAHWLPPNHTATPCLINGTPYFYVVKAVDTSGNASSASDEATATPSGGGVTCYALNLNSSANGSPPTASLANSTGCSAGEYVASEEITLTAHPESGYQVSTWSGTNNDTLKTLTNTLTMPSAPTTVTVNYEVIALSCNTLTLNSNANGTAPTASPTNSTGCSTGQYLATEDITLTAHPNAGYQVSSWTGTNNDSLKTLTNALTMPAGIRTVTVNYSRIPSAACGTDPNLVGCWQMEENGGTTLIDGSSFANDGALVSPQWVAGKTGTWAINPNATNTVTIPDSDSLDLSDALTIAAWIRPMGTGFTTQTLVSKDVFTGALVAGYELNLSSAGKVFIRINNDDTNYRLNSATSYPINGSAWMHVAVTFSSTSLKVYINGIEDASKTVAATSISTNTLPLALGRQPGDLPRANNGYLDDVRIYNRALSQGEIQTLANTPPAAPTGLTATPGNTTVALSWTANSESDLAGYNIYRSTTAGVPLTSPINGGTLVTGTTYNDTGRTNGQIYYYIITAVDTSTNQSVASNEAHATPGGDITPPAAPPF